MLQRRSFGCDLTPERGHPTARHERRRREGPATLYSRLRTGAARPSVLEHALAGRMPALPAHGRVRMNAAIGLSIAVGVSGRNLLKAPAGRGNIHRSGRRGLYI